MYACKNDIDCMKSLLESSQEFSKILVLFNENKEDIQNKLMATINSYKEEDIDQLLFYFSGHGHRDEKGDFFFCLQNTNTDSINSTAISYTGLDDFLRQFNANFVCKIIDACYAGQQYIKGSQDDFWQKKSQDNTFKDVYYMYSSSCDETSLATSKISLFTKYFISALDDISLRNDKVMYRNIGDYLADREEITPYFNTQGFNTEYFLNDTKKIKKVLGELKKLVSEDVKNQKEKSYIDIIKQQAVEFYSKEEGMRILNEMASSVFEIDFSEDLKQLFDITKQKNNKNYKEIKSIGNWLEKNTSNKKNDVFFAEPSFEDRVVTEQKYVKRPKKPDLFGLSRVNFMRRDRFSADFDFVLEEVSVNKPFLDGFSYIENIDINDMEFSFRPKKEFPNLFLYVARIIIVFSKSEVVFFYNVEDCSFKNWVEFQSPTNKEWKVIRYNIKDIQNDKICQFFKEKISNCIRVSLNSYFKISND